MRKMFALAVLVAAFVSTPAAAALSPVVSTTVTTSGTFGGSTSSLTDGVFPADGSNYNGAGEVFFGSGDGFTPTTIFTFNFGGLYSIDELMATVDNNDNYQFQFYNGSTFVGATNILGSQGSVGFGVETFTLTGLSFLADRVSVSANGGDSRYSLGEVQVRGNLVAGAVPEPATWAMMLAGFGGIGFAMRRQRKADAKLARIA